MDQQPDTTGNYRVARDAAQKKIAAIAMLPGTKIPAVRWKRYQTELPSDELLRVWFLGTRMNIAIVCTGLVIFDCDDIEKAKLVLSECGDTPHKIKTPRGIHLGYRRRMGVVLTNQVRIKGMEIDIRTNGGLEMIPHSRTEHGTYSWLGEGLRPISELPVATIGWTRERKRTRIRPTIEIADADVMVRRARGYLACIEGAVSGRRGHDRTFRVACKLLHPPPRGFGLTLEQAWALFLEWNEQCEPPWSQKELLHKLQDAEKRK